MHMKKTYVRANKYNDNSIAFRHLVNEHYLTSPYQPPATRKRNDQTVCLRCLSFAFPLCILCGVHSANIPFRSSWRKQRRNVVRWLCRENVRKWQPVAASGRNDGRTLRLVYDSHACRIHAVCKSEWHESCMHLKLVQLPVNILIMVEMCWIPLNDKATNMFTPTAQWTRISKLFIMLIIFIIAFEHSSTN